MSRDPSLNAMIYFEAVARHGRVAKAAEDLKVSPSAVSQQIKLLEEILGVNLFRRDRRQLSLTLEGEQLYIAVSSALGLLRNARQSVSRNRESHQLIIKVMPSFAVRWLGPRLHAFIEANPDWDLRLDVTADPSNFDREVVDMDLRYGPGSHADSLYCEEVMADYVMPLCSPEYRRNLRDQFGHDSLTLMQQARLIDSIRAALQWDNWLARHRISRNMNCASLRFDRSSMALMQAINHVGVVLESTTLARDELEQGALVPLVPDLGAIRFPAYWIVTPAHHRNRRLVQVFGNWIQAEAEEHERAVAEYLQQHRIAVHDDALIFGDASRRLEQGL